MSKNGEVYALETSCMKETSVHIKNMRIKQLSNLKVQEFAIALRARKVPGTFEKRDPGLRCIKLNITRVLRTFFFFLENSLS